MIPPRFQPVLEELAPLTARFRDAGHRLYLVGGSVSAAGAAEQHLPDQAPPALGAKLTVVNVWATWCAVCREEIPALNAVRLSA